MTESAGCALFGYQIDKRAGTMDSALKRLLQAAMALSILVAAGAHAAASERVIAFLMPCSTCADRFIGLDEPAFVAAMTAIDPGVTVNASNAQGSGSIQISQAEAAITNGADAIVVSPMTAAAGEAIVAMAAAYDIPVLSYDTLLPGAPVDFHISFDNERVGELQAQYLVDNLQKGSTIIVINGPQDVETGRLFKKGAHNIIDPAVAAGDLKIGFESDIAGWLPDEALAKTEQALTLLNDDVQGILVANDVMAGGVISALTLHNLNREVLVTGQDATDAGLQRILTGDQAMTVYKAIRVEAETAGGIADLLARRRFDKLARVPHVSVNNGTSDVPTILLDPVAVTAETLAETVLKDGFTTLKRLCINGTSEAEICRVE